MRFEICHELDAPLDAVELAVLSPEMERLLARSVAPGIESVDTVHTRYKAASSAASCASRRARRSRSSRATDIAGRDVLGGALELSPRRSRRDLGGLAAGAVPPLLPRQRHLPARADPRRPHPPRRRRPRDPAADARRGRRRMALAEVRKTYDAEAETLRRLATL